MSHTWAAYLTLSTVTLALLFCGDARPVRVPEPQGRRVAPRAPDVQARADEKQEKTPHKVVPQGVPGQVIEDPSGTALVRFSHALWALKKGQRKQVRVMHWGDSHVANDVFTGRMRTLLQSEFGDRGPGFVLLGRPWRSYYHAAAHQGIGDKRWQLERWASRYSPRLPRPRDDYLGFAGISVYATSPRATFVGSRSGSLTQLGIYYLAQPGGGIVELSSAGRSVGILRTRAVKKTHGYRSFKLPPWSNRIILRTSRGEVRLFGADLRRSGPGVVYDALGINGARADVHLHWNKALVAEQLKELDPDLIILAYGSNEIDAEAVATAVMARRFEQVVGRLRELRPKADCIVIGPPDQARYVRKLRRFAHPPRLATIVAYQRRVALSAGCGFWDQRAAMGGARAIFSWRDASPPMARRDHVHFSVAGYRSLAETFHRALLRSYQALRVRAVAKLLKPSGATP